MPTASTQSPQEGPSSTSSEVFFFRVGEVLLGFVIVALAFVISLISSVISLGFVFMMAYAVAKGFIIPRLHKGTVKALVSRMSVYALYIGSFIIVLGLVLIFHESFQGRFWYRVVLWTIFVLLIVVLPAVFLAWVGKSTTLRRSTPQKKHLFAARHWYTIEAHPEKSLEDRITFTGCKWEDVVRIRPHLSKRREPIPQNHIICLDGTWNDAESETNVQRLFKLLSDHCNNGEPQIARYYTGVGINENEGSSVEVLGEEVTKGIHGLTAEIYGEEVTKGILQSVTGLGERSIRWLAYFDLVTTYQPGDRICIFGFSRGASSARILANFISEYGVPERIQAEFQRAPVYKGKPIEPDRLVDLAVLGDKKRDVEIHMIGLWDTVAAFGLPSNKFEPFRKLSIPDNARKVFHLVAIDERRWEFDATLIEHDARNNRIEEIWFAGAHTNVGGGSGDNRLSDIALRFMINRASEQGICFKPGWASELKEDVKGPEWPLWPLWPKWFTRRIRVEGGEPKALPRIHKSVFERRASVIGYDPRNLRELEKAYAIEDMLDERN
jgi:hypothetical protein